MTTMFITDNRYSPGASGASMPSAEYMCAAYSARWIDRDTRAEMLPDRQGFAYDRTECRDLLIARLVEARLDANLPRIPRDVSTDVSIEDADWCIVMRRAGGYVYVDAWLWADDYGDGSRTCEYCHGSGWCDAPSGCVGNQRCGCTV
jgi:hypothetical protein